MRPGALNATTKGDAPNAPSASTESTTPATSPATAIQGSTTQEQTLAHRAIPTASLAGNRAHDAPAVRPREKSTTEPLFANAEIATTSTRHQSANVHYSLISLYSLLADLRKMFRTLDNGVHSMPRRFHAHSRSSHS